MASNQMSPRPTTAGLAAVVLLTTLTVGGIGVGSAQADDPTPGAPPGSVTSAVPPEVDANSPGLRLADGATLADVKVLDIKSVVEDLGGEERREDTNQDVKFALQAEVLFPKDSSTLNPDARSRIRAIADEIKSQRATNIRVFGFTDDLGSYEHGKVLSKKRADAVHDALAADLGPEITYEVRGYSEDYPIADNTSEQGRRKNRRVEVSFPRGEQPASESGGDTAAGSSTP
ncbi:OmpA family protein [Streptomyces sp. NPDC091292]|uniref:OmpA family protein n=1 Tax=Streptomyces sp. NPDC091292 TaxID=3365991 RepID=UPI00382D8F9B